MDMYVSWLLRRSTIQYVCLCMSEKGVREVSVIQQAPCVVKEQACVCSPKEQVRSEEHTSELQSR